MGTGPGSGIGRTGGGVGTSVMDEVYPTCDDGHLPSAMSVFAVVDHGYATSMITVDLATGPNPPKRR